MPEAKAAERDYIEYVEKFHAADILTPIRESGEMKPETEEALKGALMKFMDSRKKV